MNTIDTFIANWESQAIEAYVALKNELETLQSTKWNLMTEYKLETRKPRQEIPADYSEAIEAVGKFKMSLAASALKIISDRNPKAIVKAVSKEALNKKANLIKRIEKKAGKIVDCGFLTLGVDGNINGYVQGETKQVTVQTIYAGGYNIQKLHYRVLVK